MDINSIIDEINAISANSSSPISTTDIILLLHTIELRKLNQNLNRVKNDIGTIQQDIDQIKTDVDSIERSTTK